MIPHHFAVAWPSIGAIAGQLTGAFGGRWALGIAGDIGVGALGGILGGLLFFHSHIRFGSPLTTAMLAACAGAAGLVAMTRAVWPHAMAR
jgi:uncharacterized membrane protein YeaQ/YmgE (transglycosylase-associated protein family)